MAAFEPTEISMRDGGTMQGTKLDASLFSGLTSAQIRYGQSLTDMGEKQAFANAARAENVGRKVEYKANNPGVDTGGSNGLQQVSFNGQQPLDVGKPNLVTQANVSANVASGSKAADEAIAAAQGANNAIDGLQTIYKLASNHPEAFGTGAAGFAKFKSYLSNIPGFGYLNEAKSVQDVIGKLSASLAGGSRTDAELQNKLAALPGTEKTAEAVKEVIPLLISQNLQGQSRAAVIQHARDAAGGDNTVVQRVAQQFDNLASPRLVASGHELARLTNVSGANVAGTPANRAMADYVNRLKESGAYDKVLQLNSMGAF